MKRVRFASFSFRDTNSESYRKILCSVFDLGYDISLLDLHHNMFKMRDEDVLLLHLKHHNLTEVLYVYD